MSDKDTLIQQLDDARQTLKTALAGIPQNTRIYSGWTLKHLLAHVAGWDDAVITSLQAHINGNEPATPAVRGIDYYNAESVVTRETLPYERVYQEWELAREQLKTVIREMSQEKFTTPLLFPWGSMGTVAQVVKIFVEHEREHAADLEALKAELVTGIQKPTVPDQPEASSEKSSTGETDQASKSEETSAPPSSTTKESATGEGEPAQVEGETLPDKSLPPTD